MYKLKANFEEFVVVEGPFARKKFERGVLYPEVPLNEIHRFDEINTEPVKPTPARSIKRLGRNEAAAGPEKEVLS